MANAYFTVNGAPVTPPIPSPPNANDFHVVWNDPVIVKAFWTAIGWIIGPPIKLPVGVPINEAHLTVP
ncbi:MAG TPA: hypothetical protein VKT80_08525 [Chloroflexota bacterium]|nr:hypothetical protein [Chloroflexota bacterium]